MENYNIKITGTGTRAQIIKSLLDIANSIEEFPFIDAVTLEDAVLCAEIDINEEEEEEEEEEGEGEIIPIR